MAASAAGCARDESAATTADDGKPIAAAPAGALTPLQTVAEVHASRWRGQYGAMQALIVPEQRDAVMDLVLAVDQLISAEDALQQTLRTSIGEGSAEQFRRRQQVANIIGPLSRDVEIIDEHIDGQRAEVTIQVAARVPLERVELVQSGTGWLVRTDEPIPGLSEALSELAAVTRRFSGEVSRGRLEARAIERELTLRQTPVLRRIARLTADAQKAQANGAPD